jgi:hemoglobin-like flavoprotein
MTQETATKLQNHYMAIAPKSDALVERFYSTLFESHPAIRGMFPADMGRQREHLATALAVIARNYGQLAILEEPLIEMGARHAAYGAKPEHYSLVREALLNALAWVSGDAWTAELAEIWRAAIDRVAVSMLRGAAAVEATRCDDKRACG